MMNTCTLFSALLAVFIGAVSAAPVPDPDLQDVAAIATMFCSETNTTKQMSSENIPQISESDVLQTLHDEMLETIDEINSTLGLMKNWEMDQFLAGTSLKNCDAFSIQLQQVNHTELSPVENSRLHQLLLMSSYVHFLKSRENDSDAYGDITSWLQNLTQKINNGIVIALNELLPRVTCDAIKNYVDEDVRGHLLSQAMENSFVRRIICYCTMKSMLHNFIFLSQ